MLNRYHVAAVSGDDVEKPGELTGNVWDPDPVPGEAPGGGQATSDHPVEQQQVDVATGQHDDHRIRHPVEQPVEKRSNPHRAGRLHHQLRPLQQEGNRLHGLRIVDRDQVVDEGFDVIEGEL